MGTPSASPSSPVPRPCTTVDRPCTQAPGGLWDTPRLRRLGRGAALRTGSPSSMSLGRSGLPDRPDDRSSEPPATYKDAQTLIQQIIISLQPLSPGKREGRLLNPRRPVAIENQTNGAG